MVNGNTVKRLGSIAIFLMVKVRPSVNLSAQISKAQKDTDEFFQFWNLGAYNAEHKTLVKVRPGLNFNVLHTAFTPTDPERVKRD